MDERVKTLPGIWGSSADTVIPVPPVPGVSYRKSTLSASEIAVAQPYSNVFDSSKWNQAMHLLYSLLRDVEQQGILVYSRLTTYAPGALCLGVDGNLYQCLLDNSPSSIHTPAEDTYWKNLISTSPVYLDNPVTLAALVMQNNDQPGEERTIDMTALIPEGRKTVFFKLRTSGTVTAIGTVGFNFGSLSGEPLQVANFLYFNRGSDYIGHYEDWFFQLSAASSKLLKYKFVNGISGSAQSILYMLGYA